MLKVKSHTRAAEVTDDPLDIYLWIGNEMADKLAEEAARRVAVRPDEEANWRWAQGVAAKVRRRLARSTLEAIAADPAVPPGPGEVRRAARRAAPPAALPRAILATEHVLLGAPGERPRCLACGSQPSCRRQVLVKWLAEPCRPIVGPGRSPYLVVAPGPVQVGQRRTHPTHKLLFVLEPHIYVCRVCGARGGGGRKGHLEKLAEPCSGRLSAKGRDNLRLVASRRL